jgi:S1-C subfamily serine protease
MKIKKHKQDTWKIIVRIIVLSIILGGISGIVTAALTTNYLADYAIELADYTQPLRIGDENVRSFPKSHQEAVSRIKDEVLPGVVTFFDKTDANQIGVYSLDDAYAQGAVLTSDGWLVSTVHFTDTFSQYVAVVQGQEYEVEQVVTDEITGASFVKVFANNLPVISFGSGWDAAIGDQVFILPTQDSLITTSVSQIKHDSKETLSSDAPTRQVYLQYATLSSLIGSPVINLSSELIGFCVEAEQESEEYRSVFLSLDSILPSFTSLLENGEIVRAGLDLDFIDLSSVIGLDDSLSRGYEYGALVSGVDSSEKVIMIGDIILSVDGMMIDYSRSLDEYLTEYKIEDEIILTIDRDGVREDVHVILE